MYIVSITGKTGSGKSKISKGIANIFGDKAMYIDIDIISRSTMNYDDNIKQAVDIWGKSILDENGKIERKKFRQVVFSSKENRDILTKISLPMLKKLLFEKIEKSKNDIIILDWAFIPEVEEIFNICDLKILVKADESIRKNRILKRDNLTEAEFLARNRFAMNYDEEKFDIVIVNNRYDEDMKEELNKIYNIVSLHL